MKTKMFFLMFYLSAAACVFATTVPPDYVPKGLVGDIDFNYGRTFKNGYSIMSVDGFMTAFPAPVFTYHIGHIFLFSPHVNVWDLYGCVGMTIYPFRKILSFSFGFGMGCSFMLLLNHFPYIAQAKLNIDIPIYRNHYITAGAGVQHRNTVKMINYMKWNNYYGIHNTYFFQVGYRYIIK